MLVTRGDSDVITFEKGNLDESLVNLLKAEYVKILVKELIEHLHVDFGEGYSAFNLWLFRCFYEEYPDIAGPEILYAPRKESRRQAQQHKFHAPRGKSGFNIPHALCAELNAGTISDALCRKTVVGDDPISIGYSPSSQSIASSKNMAGRINHAVRDKFSEALNNSETTHRKSEKIPVQGKQPNQHALRVESSVIVTLLEISHALRSESWQLGQQILFGG